MLDIDPENLTGADLQILGAVSTVRLEMGVAMAPQVADYLQVLLESGAKKLVVFGWHKEVLSYIEDQLAPWGVVKVDGSDSGASKEFKIHQFIYNPNVDVIVGNVLSLGTGTDGLQGVAHHCLFAEPDWVSGNNDQCVKRLARIGQASRVMADFFLVENSFSEAILAKSLRKGKVIHKVLDRGIIDMVEASKW